MYVGFVFQTHPLIFLFESLWLFNRRLCLYIHSGIKYIGIWQRKMVCFPNALTCVLNFISVPLHGLETLKPIILTSSDL